MSEKDSNRLLKYSILATIFLAVNYYSLMIFDLYFNNETRLEMVHVYIMILVFGIVLTVRFPKGKFGNFLEWDDKKGFAKAILSRSPDISFEGISNLLNLKDTSEWLPDYLRELDKVPRLDYQITQVTHTGGKRKLPDVGFNISNYSAKALKLYVIVKMYLGGEIQELKVRSKYYNGSKIWNINPNQIIYGHFNIPTDIAQEAMNGKRLELRVDVKVSYPTESKLLDLGWVFMPKQNEWYFEP